MIYKKSRKNLIIICDSFPPEITSAAIQLRDLSHELCELNVDLTVICPSQKINQAYKIEKNQGKKIIRIKISRLKDNNKIIRALLEMWLPVKIIALLVRNPHLVKKCDGIIYYSPSIFHGPLVHYLKIKHKCKSFLILRDIFPDWALDLGVIRKGLPYFFLKAVQRYQYFVANHIGIQSQGNQVYFNKSHKKTKQKIMLLRNWLRDGFKIVEPSAALKHYLQSKKVFVYCGNVGIAQNFNPLFKAIEELKNDPNLHFLIIGDGMQKTDLKVILEKNEIKNITLMRPIPEDKLMGILKYCDYGMVILDKDHKSHNIPGKYLTYLRSNLPVLALVNLGNDIINEIHNYRVGFAIENSNPSAINRMIYKLAELEESQVDNLRHNSRFLYSKKYKSQAAAKLILEKLECA